jgi:hypothetical protein
MENAGVAKRSRKSHSTYVVFAFLFLVFDRATISQTATARQQGFRTDAISLL